MAHSFNHQHAIIIGGSMTGLLAARVLAARFEQVTIIERDQLPIQAEHRKGVPQSKHVHVLLSKGEQIIEQLFPGIGRELDLVHGKQFDLGREGIAIVDGHVLPRAQSGITSRAISRIALEAQVRSRVFRLDNVTFIQQAEVKELLTTADQTTVTGVSLRYRGGTSGPDHLTADLVIDASGRNTKAPKWLEALGYGTPEETVVNSFLGYGSRRYAKPAGFDGDWKMIFAFPSVDNPRGGILMEEESGDWVLTVAGASHLYPPTDEEGFMAFVKQTSPNLYEAVKNATPVSDIYGYRRTENRWRHYEKLGRWPANFAVMGDATCGFNPTYGQGMSSAALQAIALSEMIDQKQTTQQFQQHIAKVVTDIWLLATAEDFRYPETEGKRNGLMTPLTHWYLDKMRIAVLTEQSVLHAFIEVQQLLRPPTHLFKPSIMWQVFRANWHNKTTQKVTTGTTAVQQAVSA